MNRTNWRISAALIFGVFAINGCQAPVAPPDAQARNCADPEALNILIDATDLAASQARAQLMSGLGDDACLDEADLLALLDTSVAGDAGEDADPILVFSAGS